MLYLADETVDVAMPEVLGQHDLLKFVDVLDDELGAASGPEYYFVELSVLI